MERRTVVKMHLNFEQTRVVRWDGPKKTFIHKSRQAVLRIWVLISQNPLFNCPSGFDLGQSTILGHRAGRCSEVREDLAAYNWKRSTFQP